MKNVFLKNCFLYNWATQYNPDSYEYDPFPANTPVSRNIINSAMPLVPLRSQKISLNLGTSNKIETKKSKNYFIL